MPDDGSSISSFPLKEVRKRRGPRPQTPKGKLEVVVTYLEMNHRPNRPPAPHRGEKLALMRVERPVPSFYRYLYNTVGAPWLWYERRLMDDDSLCDIVHHHQVEVYVLYVGGNPAGFVELDCRAGEDIEIAFLGLLPEFIGRGLGHYPPPRKPVLRVANHATRHPSMAPARVHSQVVKPPPVAITAAHDSRPQAGNAIFAHGPGQEQITGRRIHAQSDIAARVVPGP